MASPYTSTSVSSYNSNPPADDGSAVAANQILWATIKTKLSDPLNTFASNVNSNISTAFGKVIGGAGVTSSGIDYTVLSTDQGKLIRATASGITVTTPDATVVTSPFVFAFLNNSSGSVTFDGNGSQTVDGNANLSVPSGSGFVVFTDGSNWFTTGRQGTLVGAQLRAGDILNGTITESNATNAVTYNLKTLAGNDPSASDPVVLCFRNATVGNGNYVYRTITAAMSLTISSGSTLGTTSSTAFKVWIVIFDDGGTLRMGAINTVSGTNIYPLGQNPIASSTAEGGAGAADSAQVFYTGTAVTSKAYNILGYCSYESGMGTAGSWNASPTRIVLFGDGVPLPGAVIQTVSNYTGAVATGSTQIPFDNSIPQNTEGDQYMSQAVTPTSAANLLEIEAEGLFTVNSTAQLSAALFQDATVNALVATTSLSAGVTTTGFMSKLRLVWAMLAGTTSATTFKYRAGPGGAVTTDFNGDSTGTRLFGGVANSFMRIVERMT